MMKKAEDGDSPDDDDHEYYEAEDGESPYSIDDADNNDR